MSLQSDLIEHQICLFCPVEWPEEGKNWSKENWWMACNYVREVIGFGATPEEAVADYILQRKANGSQEQ